MGCRRSPFLNMGTTLAVVQSVGIIPCFSEAWKISVNVGVISSASVLKCYYRPTASLQLHNKRNTKYNITVT